MTLPKFRRLVSRAGLAGGGAPNKDSYRPALTHSSWVNNYAGWYYVLSAPLSAKRFTEVARAHWGIENGLHWVLDVTMNEDQARNRKDNGPENISLLRRLALNLIRLEGSKGSVKGKLKRAGWNDGFLTTLLSQFAKIHMR